MAFSGSVPQSTGAPMLCENNHEIYEEILGIASEDLEEFERKGII